MIYFCLRLQIPYYFRKNLQRELRVKRKENFFQPFIGVGKLFSWGDPVLNCDIIINEFKLQFLICVHFRRNTLRKGMNSFSSPATSLTVPLLFYKDG